MQYSLSFDFKVIRQRKNAMVFSLQTSQETFKAYTKQEVLISHKIEIKITYLILQVNSFERKVG